MSPSEITPRPDPLSEVLTLVQAAQLSGIAAHTFAQQAEKGILRARKVGHTWITTKTAVAEYLRLHARRGHQELPGRSETHELARRSEQRDPEHEHVEVGESTPSRIMVAVDGSPESLRASWSAFALARNVGATVTLIHVAQPHLMRSSFDSAPQWREAEADARQAGEQIIDRARAISGLDVPCASEVLFGDPAKTISRRARELDTDLIVMGSRGLGPFKRLLLGSVSTAVSQQAPCSVLIVRERASK